MKKLPHVMIYSDGACTGNPGPGGWAAILRDGASGKEKRISGGERETTNNRMELMGVIRGLEALKQPCRATIVSDSQYVVKGLDVWLAGWLLRGWKSSTGAPVKNRDLWQRLVELKAIHQVSCMWVEGHSGHRENEECDRLAREAIGHARR